MNENVLVTVLMSMYNTPEDELKESIQSILNQTYKNFEFLIIDDSCTDNSVEIVRSYKDSRIRIVYNEKNIGLVKSLNKGIQLAKSDYIVRMDTDDIAHERRIEKQLEFIIKNPKYAIVSGKAQFFDDNGVYGLSYFSGEVRKADLIFGNPFIHPAMIINKKALIDINGYPNYRRCEDYAMVMNMYANGYVGFVMNDTLIKYRLDKNAYLKKKKRDRIIEFKAKFIFFKKMKIKWYKFIYIFKPIILIFVPNVILRLYHKRKFNQKEVIC